MSKELIKELSIPAGTNRRVIAGIVDINIHKPSYSIELSILEHKRHLIKCDEVIAKFQTYYATAFNIENNTEEDPLFIKIYKVEE